MNASFTYYLVISEKRDDLWLSDDVFVGVFMKRGKGNKTERKKGDSSSVRLHNLYDTMKKISKCSELFLLSCIRLVLKCICHIVTKSGNGGCGVKVRILKASMTWY